MAAEKNSALGLNMMTAPGTCGLIGHSIRVAEQCGFGSARQLRRAWQRIHKTPPREARIH